MTAYRVRRVILSLAAIAIAMTPMLGVPARAADAPSAQDSAKTPPLPTLPLPKNVLNADSALGATAGMGQTAAADANQFNVDKSPDPHKIPVMADAVKDPKLRIFPLGHIYGTDGWFTITDKKQIQVFYTTADGHGMVIGALFDAQGNNITAQQIVALRDRDPYVQSLFSEAAQTVAQSYKDRIGNSTVSTADARLLSPGERLLKEMLVTNWVGIGDSKAPVLYMVVDPRCPHCKNAFKSFGDQVKAGKLQVRLMPVDILGGDSRVLAADLIAASDPTTVWGQMMSGDTDSLKQQSPGEDALEKVDFNRSIFDRWKMPATPYFVYRGRDGKVKILEGEPEDPAALVSDLSTN